MADRRNRRTPTTRPKEQERTEEVRGVQLEPIRHVTRELTRPDGTKLVVKVPVYPPFQLRDHSATQEKRGRKATSEKKAS